MPDLLIKNIEEEVLEKLKARARRNGRSLEDEIKTILRRAADHFTDAELARKIKDSLRGYHRERQRRTFARRQSEIKKPFIHSSEAVVFPVRF